MTEKQKKLIRTFKRSQDYRDICYMIDHVENTEVLLSCIEGLNYKLGTNMMMKENKRDPKSVIIGTNGEFRVQITKCEDMFAACAIVERKNKTNTK